MPFPKTPQPRSTPVVITQFSEPVAIIKPQGCNPLASDYCILDGDFVFQNPLKSSLVDSLSTTYQYGSTGDGRREPHHGVDMASELGVSVFASASGEVIFADSDRTPVYSPRRNFYGNLIVIRHENDLYTLYGHLSRILVSPGQEVKAGDLIGEVGHSGVAIGSHLHFEVRRGGDGRDYFSTQNPELWLTLEKDQNGESLGAMVIYLDIGLTHKVQRNLIVEYFPLDAEAPLKVIPITTYPNGFEQNKEDAVLSNLPPGRYRITFKDRTGVRHRWVYIEAGKLTQVNFIVK